MGSHGRVSKIRLSQIHWCKQLWHKKLTQLLENATIPPTVNQVEMSSSWQQGKLREFCKQKGIHLAAWSPFSSKVTDIGIHFLKGLQNLALLNLEGCFVTAACLDTLAELPALSNLNISRCNFTNNGCEMFSRKL
ncbi:hypothetical protein HN51_066764 [Arachis hypogaea]|nr:Methylecgonone reductase [Arachis hypogaea]